eukprot:488217_1
MNGNIIHKETIIDEHKKSVTIDFSICDENDSHIFYMQPLHQERKDVEYGDLQGFMKDTLVEILVKFHQYDEKLFKKKKKGELIEIICKLHSIAIALNPDKLNIALKEKQTIVAKVKNEADQILILLREYLEQDELYSKVPHLLDTYEYLCSEQSLMDTFEECICTIFLHFVEQWQHSKSETDFLDRYRLFQRKLTDKHHLHKFKIDMIEKIFSADECIPIKWTGFIYGINILLKKLTIKLVTLRLGDYLVGVYEQKHDMFKDEFSGDELKYFATCFLGSSATSHLRTVHATYKYNKKDVLLILDRMLIKYKTIDELRQHNVSQKLLKENDGYMRIIKQEFVDWGIDILNLTSIGLKRALITNGSLEEIITNCRNDKILQKFVCIFDAMDVMDDTKDETFETPLNLELVRKTGIILSRKLVTRMSWAMMRDKKNDQVAAKIQKQAKLLHLSNKRLELCKNK